jgi:hypothetical protein
MVPQGYYGMPPQGPRAALPGPMGMPQVPPGYTLVQGPNGQPVMVPTQQLQQMQMQQGFPGAEDEEDDDDEDGDDEEDEDEDDDGDDEGEEGEEDEAENTAAVTALNPAAQKAARTALRTLVVKLGKAPEAEWEGLIATAIATEPSVYHYAQAVSIKKALPEAGANPKLTARIITALKASSLVPSDLRYE